jgi:hypothetical protein
MTCGENDVIPLLNRALSAVSRRGEPTHYPSILVPLALYNMMRHATDRFNGRLWVDVDPQSIQREIDLDDAIIDGALGRLKRIGLITVRERSSEDQYELDPDSAATFTTKCLRRLRPDTWHRRFGRRSKTEAAYA